MTKAFAVSSAFEGHRQSRRETAHDRVPQRGLSGMRGLASWPPP